MSTTYVFGGCAAAAGGKSSRKMTFFKKNDKKVYVFDKKVNTVFVIIAPRPQAEKVYEKVTSLKQT